MLNLELLVIIIDRDASEELLDICSSKRIPLSLAALGRGTATQEILDMFSLEQSEKAVIFSVAKSEKARAAMRKFRNGLAIRAPGSGIAFTVPISSIGGIHTVNVLSDGSPIERKEYPVSTDQDFELIIVVSDEGYSNLVMDAARNIGGATGGTIIHARGVDSDQTKKFFGISLSEEKEMLLIVCRAKQRNRIMHAVIENAGATSPARSIIFSVPVSSTAGLWTLPEEEEPNE